MSTSIEPPHDPPLLLLLLRERDVLARIFRDGGEGGLIALGR